MSLAVVRKIGIAFLRPRERNRHSVAEAFPASGSSLDSYVARLGGGGIRPVHQLCQLFPVGCWRSHPRPDAIPLPHLEAGAVSFYKRFSVLTNALMPPPVASCCA